MKIIMEMIKKEFFQKRARTHAHTVLSYGIDFCLLEWKCSKRKETQTQSQAQTDCVFLHTWYTSISNDWSTRPARKRVTASNTRARLWASEWLNEQLAEVKNEQSSVKWSVLKLGWIARDHGIRTETYWLMEISLLRLRKRSILLFAAVAFVTFAIVRSFHPFWVNACRLLL